METVLVLPSKGREIALDSITDLKGVMDVWWPYEQDGWPPSRVKGWQLNWDDARPILVLNAIEGSEPQAGDELRLFYFTYQKIAGLDGASHTTVPVDHETLLVMGAAGFAASFGALDRSEVLNVDFLRKWGNNTLAWFRDRLKELRSASIRSDGIPFRSGWSLDKWDNT